MSRVLNGHEAVSPPTRARVRTAIDKLGYLPSPAARALSRRRTDSVGVVVPFFTHPSAVERLRGVVARLADSCFHLVLFDVERPGERDEPYADVLGRYRTDGLLSITLTPGAADARRLAAAELPVVIVDGRSPGVPCVYADDRIGGAQAAAHLLERGHRRIAYVGDEPNPRFGFVSAHERRSGFEAALAGAGLAMAPEHVKVSESPYGRADARRQAHELLAQPHPPTAVFGYSDTQALGVLDAARDLGVAVPEQLSVIGFDDLDSAEHAGLTTVRQPLFESGLLGADLLVRLLEGASLESSDIALEHTVIERTTVGPPPREERRCR